MMHAHANCLRNSLQTAGGPPMMHGALPLEERVRMEVRQQCSNTYTSFTSMLASQ